MWINEEVVLFDKRQHKASENMGINREPEKEFRRCMINLDEIVAIMEPIKSGTMIDMSNGVTMTMVIDYDDFMIKYGKLLTGKKTVLKVEENLDEY